MTATYTVELYNSQNATQTLIADITPLVQNLSFNIPTNDMEDLEFTLETEAWKDYCQKIGINPYLSLKPLTAEIKLVRNGAYLPCVFEIKQAPKQYTATGSAIQVRARGVLSKLGDATITKTYTDEDPLDIARDAIAVRQAKPYGDFGITNGNLLTLGDAPTTRTYQRYYIHDAIRNLSDDEVGGFDFFFDHDWTFHPMAQRGSLKTDITYRYGAEDANILEYGNPEDGTVIANSIDIVGEGIGDPMVGTALDVESAETYGLREKPLIHSNISNQEWLDNKAATELRDRKEMYDLPSIVVSGEDFDLNDKWVGDTIPLVCTDEASPYTGNGRIKHLRVMLDDNHNERIVVECMKV